MEALYDVTVAILAQGTHWALAAKQAFCTSGEALGRGERAGSTPGSVTSGERERGVECAAEGNAPFGGKGAVPWKKKERRKRNCGVGSGV